ncbi:LPXTG cell wall anchor domain-containing protein [bacterium]|nr:LPXTG cell wall anchor domain-containing protein [bacterium]
MIGFLSKKVLTFQSFSFNMSLIRSNVMLQFANQYSFLLAGILLLLLAGGLLAWRRRGLRAREAILLLLVAAVIGLGWLASRPSQAASVNADQMRSQVGQGKALLLEFQSPY